MKLRIKGNSIRIRLMQSEVKSLENEGVYQEEVQFPSGEKLTYILKVEEKYGAKFGNNELTVTIPSDESRDWFTSEDLSLRSVLTTPEGGELSLLIEKDLECLLPREGEDESDAYPNPKK